MEPYYTKLCQLHPTFEGQYKLWLEHNQHKPRYPFLAINNRFHELRKALPSLTP